MKNRPLNNLASIPYDPKANFKFIIDGEYLSQNVLSKFEDRIKLKDEQWDALRSTVTDKILPKINAEIKKAIESILIYEALIKRNKKAISADSCYVVTCSDTCLGAKPFESYYYFFNKEDAALFIEYRDKHVEHENWRIEKAT